MNGLRDNSEEFAPWSTAAPKKAPEPVAKSIGKARKKAEPDQTSGPILKARVFVVMLAIADGEPMVCLEPGAGAAEDALPCAAFRPGEHQSLEQALADVSWLDVGSMPRSGSSRAPTSRHIQQIDCRLAPVVPDAREQFIDITYLVPVSPDVVKSTRKGARRAAAADQKWQSLFVYLPWEDWRQGRPHIVETLVRPHLNAWARPGRPARPRGLAAQSKAQRQNRIQYLFANDPAEWDEDQTVERFQLMVEAGLMSDDLPTDTGVPMLAYDPRLGQVMAAGSRRRLAIALGALRRAVRHRPDVRSLMLPEFTLFDLQRCVEVILGPSLHKQNFRRQVETQGLLEPTGRVNPNTGGRPAQLYRFRRDRLSQ